MINLTINLTTLICFFFLKTSTFLIYKFFKNLLLILFGPQISKYNMHAILKVTQRNQHISELNDVAALLRFLRVK